jgi:hypothetical protein
LKGLHTFEFVGAALVAARRPTQRTVLAKIASPIVWFPDISGSTVLHALGYREQREHRVSDEEIRSLIAEAESAGVIEPSERAMIAGVMRLGDRSVRAVMTPRHDVDMVNLLDDANEVRRIVVESVHSRLPVYEGTPEVILGVLQAKDLLNAYLSGETPNIRPRLRVAPVIPDTADALDVDQRRRPEIAELGGAEPAGLLAIVDPCRWDDIRGSRNPISCRIQAPGPFPDLESKRHPFLHGSNATPQRDITTP